MNWWFIYYFGHSEVKASDSTNFYNQTFNSRAVVFEVYLGKAGNITEAPPVADEARRCWRKTRSIAPAPRAIGDYVLRGLNRLAKQDARARIVWTKRVYGRMCWAADWEPRAVYCGSALRGYRGDSPLFCFSFARRFLFQIKRKCRNAESVKSLIIVGREGSKPIINNLQLLWPCIGYADSGQPRGLSLQVA